MKLKKLHIENVASISSCDIDFENDIKDGVFLITGETGTGKTTILDAICLALYGRTPRLSNSPASEQYDANSNLLGLRTNHCEQLLRHGTKEARVTLSFVGNDGHDYTASWSISLVRHRSVDEEGNPTYGVGQPNQQIKKVGNDKTNYAKQVQSLVGVDFNNFCKTVLLAQGDFANFLKTDAKQKSILLESITKDTRFSDVGKMIFTIKSEKEKEKSDLIDEQAPFKAWEPEILQNMQSQKTDAETEVGKLNIESENVGKLKVWFDDTNKSTQTISKADKELAEIKKTQDSEQYKRDEKLVADWNCASEAVVSLKNKMKAESDIEKLEKNEKPNIQRSIDALLLQLSALNQELSSKEADKKEADDLIAGYSEAQVQTATNWSVIATHLNTAHSHNKKAKEYLLKANDAENNDLPDLKDNRDKAETELTSAKQNKVDTDNKIKGLTKEMGKIDPDNTLESRKDAFVNLKAELSILKSDAKTVEDKAAKLKEKTDDKLKAETALPDLEKDKSDKEADLKIKVAVFEAVRNFADATIADQAKAIRAQLKIGQFCPVCGKPIEEDLHEEMFAEKLKGPKKDFEDASEAFDKATQALEKQVEQIRQYEADILELGNELSISKGKHNKQKADNVLPLYSVCDLVAPTSDLLSENAVEVEVQRVEDYYQDNIASKWSKLNDLKGKINEQNDLSRNQQETINQKNETFTSADKKFNDKKSEISTNRELAGTESGNESQELDAVQNLIYLSGWRNLYADNFNKLFSQLSEESRKYNDTAFKVETLQKEIDKLKHDKELYTSFADAKKNSEFWSFSTPSGAVSYNPKASSNIPNVSSNITIWETNYSTATSNKQTAEKELSSFYSTNSNGIDDARLLEIKNQTKESVVKIKEKHAELEQQKQTQENLKKIAQTEIEKLVKPNVQLMEDFEFSTQNFEQRLKVLKEEIDGLNKTIGGLKSQIEKNTENQEKFDEYQDKIDKASELCNKWNRLNDMLGQSDGSLFRKIAQEYIMKMLISAANRHLHDFDPDLKLRKGKELTILIETPKAGVRSTNNLSGGQLFMVSLALALGLSDMSDSIHNRMDTLFIDEGFGTLDETFLRNVITSLDSLKNESGKRVGIISHVNELKDKISTKIEVYQENELSGSQVRIVH